MQNLKPSGGWPFVFVCALTWSLVHTAIRLFAGTRLAFDDGKENIFTQSFQFGYLPDNPPLFEWTLSLIQLATGPGLISFLILKYGLLISTCLFAYFTAERLLKDKVWASASAVSLILLYQIGWNYDQVLTHSLMVTAFSAAGIWAFVRLIQSPNLTSYLIFALIAGLGSISKYNFAGLLGVLFISALFNAETRRVVLHPFMLAVPAAIAVFLTPNLLYMADNIELYEFYISGKLGIDESSHLSRAGSGIGELLIAFISFYLPFILLIAVLAPSSLKPKAALAETSDQTTLNWLGRSAMIALIVMAIGVVVFGISTVSERYMVPFLLPSFFWLMARIKAADAIKPRLHRWMYAVGGVALIIFGARFAEVAIADAPFCDQCARWVPYEGLAAGLSQFDIDADTVFVSYEIDTAGNLRAMYPDNNVRSLLLSFYRPPISTETPDCLFIWSEDLVGAPIVPHLQEYARTEDTVLIDVPWSHPYKTEWQSTRWGITPIQTGSRFYTQYCVSE